MNCIHCNAPDAHPGTRKCTDLQACHGRQEYARGVKAALDELRDAVKLDRQRCGDDMAESLWKSELLILAHIDGEPARIVAACEEVREACARHIWAMSRRPTAEELMEMVGFARSTPLTATPLADEIAALRARVAELEAAANTAGADASAAALRAMARATNAEAERDGWRKEANRWPELLAQAVAERDARFDCKGGPGTTSPACGGCATCLHRVIEGVEVERDALRARVDELKLALGAERDRHDADGKALMQARAQVADWERRKNDRSGRPYTHEEWNLDPAEGRWNPTRVRPTVELLFAQVEAARTYARQALDYGEDCDATDLLAAMDEAKP